MLKKNPELLIKLINSANILNGVDCYPVGNMSSIYFHGENAQSLLNFKHFTDTDKHGNLSFIPVDYNILFENNKIIQGNWQRVIVLDPNVFIDYMNTNYRESFDKIINYKDTNVIDIFYKNNDIFSHMMYVTNNVIQIVFNSNCRAFKKVCTDTATVISNIFNFYFCMKNKTLSVSLKNKESVYHILLTAIIFSKKNNITLGGNLNTPLGCSAGYNAGENMKKFKDGEIYKLITDRDFRIAGFPGVGGGRSDTDFACIRRS